MTPVEPAYALQFRKLARVAGAFLVVLGSLVLIGWTLDVPLLKHLHPSFISMKPNTALVFVFIGIRLWLGTDDRTRRARQGVTLLALALVALTALQDLAQVELGIDTLLFADDANQAATFAPGRMAPAAQLGFLLLTIAALVDERPRRAWLAQLLAIIAGIVGFVSLCGYLFGVGALVAPLPAFTPIALHTAIGLLVAAAGLLASRPADGILVVFASATGAGRLMRRFQLAIVFIPLVLGWAAALAVTNAHLEPRFALALVISAGVALLGTLTWYIAASLNREEIVRRAAEAERAETDEDLAITLRSIGDALIATDADGRIRRMNPVAERMTGWPLAEAAGRPLDDVFQLVDEFARTPIASIIPKVVLEERRPVDPSNHTLLIARDGSTTPIVRSAAPIVDGNGTAVRGVVVVFRDVSRERDAERFFALSHDLLWITGSDGLFKRVNPATEALLGHTMRDMVGHPSTEFIHPDDVAAMRAARKRLEAETLIAAPLECRFRCKDGRYVWISWTASIDPATGLKYAVVRDITTAKQTRQDEHLLVELAEFLPTVTDGATVFEAISQKVGPHFEASGCFFTEFDVDAMRGVVRGDHAHGVPSMRGTYDMRDFGADMMAELAAGRPYINHDTSTDPRTRDLYETVFRPLRNRSGIGVPLMREGRLVGALVVLRADAHHWMASEVALLTSIAERAWLWAEHLRILQALRESEALSRLVVDGAKDQAIFTLDPSGHVATWNRGAERLHGFTSAEVLGKPLSVFHVAEDGVELHADAALAQAKDQGQFEDEGWRLRKDGTRFWANVSLSSLRDDAGVLRGFVKIIRDVTLRRQAERDERWKATVLSSAFDAIVSMDHRGLILEWNPAAERLFGHARRDVLGKPLADVVILPHRRELFRDGLANYHATGTWPILGTNRELVGLHADGSTRDVEVAMVRVEEQTPAIFAVFIRDISARKKLESERQELVTSLRELNASLETRVATRTAELEATLTERGVLLQEIHHRVKNNLQVISSLINMQMRQVDDDATRKALLDCQTRVTAIALVHHQLYRSTDLAQIPFSAYAQSLATTIMATGVVAADRIRLEVDTDLVSLPIDRAIPCALILTELMTNAGKYAFPGDRRGTIRIGLRRHGEDALRLTVADDGVGIPTGFDPATADSLGLTLVQTLAEQLRGQLAFAGPPGTTVQVTFRPNG